MSEKKVSRNMLHAIARSQYERTRNTLSLCEGSLARLDAAIKHCDKPDYLGFGSLRQPIPAREANDEMIEWVAESIAHFYPLRYIGHAVLRPRCVFVSSQLIDIALRSYNAAGCPESFVMPLENDWKSIDSLTRLQHELVPQHGSASLDAVPHWERIAFIINGGFHWSVLMYAWQRGVAGATPLLMHYDSIQQSHEDLVWQLCDFLYATGLVPRSVQPQRSLQTVEQTGGWQCGYAVMARLYEHGVGTFEPQACIPLLSRSANIIASRELLQFLYTLRARNEFAAHLEQLLVRWSRLYQQ